MAPRFERGQLILEVLFIVSLMLGMMYLSLKFSDAGQAIYQKQKTGRHYENFRANKR